jgi:hypothetical protein
VVALRLPNAHPGVNGLLLLGACPNTGKPLLLLLLPADLLLLGVDSRPLRSNKNSDTHKVFDCGCATCAREGQAKQYTGNSCLTEM